MTDADWQLAYKAGREDGRAEVNAELVSALMEIELAPAWEGEWKSRDAVVSGIQGIARTALAKYREGLR